MEISRSEAIKILDDLVKNRNLTKHMYCVEATMRFYAKLFNTDEEKWAIAGLLHDADWEAYPDEHPAKIVEILISMNAEEDIIQAIASHGNNSEKYGNRFQERKTLLDKTLFACDELSGFVVAVALVRPGRLTDLNPKSVIKKLKDKSFAAQVSREDIYQGAEEIGIELKEHIANIISAIKTIEAEIFD